MSIDKSQAQVELIRSESDRLKQYVNALHQDALEMPSPCPQWNIGEVIAHLVWFAETYGGMMERGLRGDQSPTEGFPAVPGTLSGPALEELYAQGAIERRRGLGKNLLVAFNERYDWLIDMVKGIGPQDWDKPCYHTLTIRPVHSFLPTIIAELAIHEWDIRSTLEPYPPLSVDSLPVLMEKIPGNRRPWTIPFGTASTSSGPKCYRFELKGAGGRRDIIVEGNNARMETSGDGSADVTLAGDTGTFVLLMYGRLTLDSAIAADLFQAEGALELIPAFDHWLEGH